MEQKLIKIFTAQDNIEAEMIIDILKRNHIPSIKEDLGNAGLMNLYGGNSKFGENIYVVETNAERATDILRGIGLL